MTHTAPFLLLSIFLSGCGARSMPWGGNGNRATNEGGPDFNSKARRKDGGSSRADLARADGGNGLPDARRWSRDARRSLADQRLPLLLDGCIPAPTCMDSATCGKGMWCNPCTRDPCCPGCGGCVARCEPAPACGNARCLVRNDCCKCEVVKVRPGDTLPPSGCRPDCAESRCELEGILSPQAYCLEGQCMMTDGARPCAKDGDCILRNDCCHCEAWPLAALSARPACLWPCKISKCLRDGLTRAAARCIEGVCMVRDDH